MRTRDLIESGLTSSEVLEWLLEDIQTKLTRDYPDQPPEVIQQAIQTDPTGGSYAGWVVKNIRNGSITVPEDLPKTTDLLQRFHRLKASPAFQGDKNIFAYRTYSDLAKLVGSQMSRGQQQELQATKGTVRISQHNDLELLRLDTPEAAATVCKNSEWCIRDPRAFENYKDFALYVVLKAGQPYVALHVGYGIGAAGGGSVVDRYDAPIDRATAREIAPLFSPKILGMNARYRPSTKEAQKYLEQKAAHLEQSLTARVQTAKGEDAEQINYWLAQLKDPKTRYKTAEYAAGHAHGVPPSLAILQAEVYALNAQKGDPIVAFLHKQGFEAKNLALDATLELSRPKSGTALQKTFWCRDKQGNSMQAVTLYAVPRENNWIFEVVTGSHYEQTGPNEQTLKHESTPVFRFNTIQQAKDYLNRLNAYTKSLVVSSGERKYDELQRALNKFFNFEFVEQPSNLWSRRHLGKPKKAA